MPLQKLQTKIGIQFQNEALLYEALTHRSYLNEKPGWKYPHNERLEFLGDAVIELAVSESLFIKFPKFPEGQMTVVRAALVNYQMLGKVAVEVGLNEGVLMSKGEAKDTGKAREVIMANAFEAFVGALYLDQGFEAAKAFIEKNVLSRVDEILREKTYKDPKSELQEIVQERLRITPSYKVLAEQGPAHQKVFTVGVFFGDKHVAESDGTSKQEAELKAAKKALELYK
jgi:ribonuclease-3